MSNLSNPHIRTRDIRTLVNLKSQDIVWDTGCDETSEWVFASLEDDSYKKKLINWLSSKNILSANEVVIVDSAWKDPKRVTWGEVLENPAEFFKKEMFQIYDVDLNWLMEYQAQEIVRFGRYN